MRNHLQKCIRYLQQAKTNGIINTITRKALEIGSTKQSKINLPSLTREEKQALDLQFASVCYVDARPFTLYESPTMIAALRRLNPAYKPPCAKSIAGPLLEQSYDTTKRDTNMVLSSLSQLNIIMDESSNINSTRIANISVHSYMGSLHYLSEDMGAIRGTAENLAAWLKDNLEVMTKADLSRINSIATDTCDMMFAMWRHIRAYPELEHCFCVPCDSHGLQLLIKDILAIPQFNDILENAQAIAKAFRKAHLQYARLREYQIQDYGKHIALVLSVITRWGSTFRLIVQVLKNKNALRHYCADHSSADLPYDAYDIIQSSTFWMQLEGLRELLEPIDNALKMSECNQSHLGLVFTRWTDIYEHLKWSKKDYPVLDEFLAPNGTFLQVLRCFD